MAIKRAADRGQDRRSVKIAFFFTISASLEFELELPVDGSFVIMVISGHTGGRGKMAMTDPGKAFDAKGGIDIPLLGIETFDVLRFFIVCVVVFQYFAIGKNFFFEKIEIRRFAEDLAFFGIQTGRSIGGIDGDSIPIICIGDTGVSRVILSMRLISRSITNSMGG